VVVIKPNPLAQARYLTQRGTANCRFSWDFAAFDASFPRQLAAP